MHTMIPNPGILKNLMVFRSLSGIFQCLWKQLQTIITPSKIILFDKILETPYVSKSASQPVQLFQVLFRRMQKYQNTIQEPTHAYSELVDPSHIATARHIHTPRYIRNTILNIFITLHLERLVLLNTYLFHGDYLTCRVTL